MEIKERKHNTTSCITAPANNHHNHYHSCSQSLVTTTTAAKQQLLQFTHSTPMQFNMKLNQLANLMTVMMKANVGNFSLTFI